MIKEDIKRTRYLLLRDKILQRYPHAKIKYQENHWFWKLMPEFIRESGRSIGNTIWMPHRDYNFNILAHEYKHLADWNSMGAIGFLSMYLSPQVPLVILFAIFAILCCGFGLYVFALICAALLILSAGPWPSKGRAFLEIQAYLLNIYIDALLEKKVQNTIDFVIDSMQDWLYYKMVWTHGYSKMLVENAIKSLKGKDTIPCDIVFQDVHEIITNTK